MLSRSTVLPFSRSLSLSQRSRIDKTNAFNVHILLFQRDELNADSFIICVWCNKDELCVQMYEKWYLLCHYVVSNSSNTFRIKVKISVDRYGLTFSYSLGLLGINGGIDRRTIQMKWINGKKMSTMAAFCIMNKTLHEHVFHSILLNCYCSLLHRRSERWHAIVRYRYYMYRYYVGWIFQDGAMRAVRTH